MAASTCSCKPLGKKNLNDCKDSLFFIMMQPDVAQKGSIRAIMNHLELVPANKVNKKSLEESYLTGFVVDEKDNQVKILTAAHCLDHVFTGEEPITQENVQNLFTFSVLCDHYEASFRQSALKGQERIYSSAEVVGIDCRKDLLLLQIDRQDILGFNGQTCQFQHPPLIPSPGLLDPFETAAMVSWPSYRPRTSAAGEMSHCCRSYADVSNENPNGYDMTLLEVNIPGQQGSSGAPLLNDDGQFFGMLHAGGVNCFSCFVCLRDILDFLSRCGVHYPDTSMEGERHA